MKASVHFVFDAPRRGFISAWARGNFCEGTQIILRNDGVFVSWGQNIWCLRFL